MSEKEKHNPIVVSLICNILLVMGKGITGFLANSNALVADAIHSMTDVCAFLISYRACKDCELYGRIDKNKTSTTISQKIAQTEIWATYSTGMLLLTVGAAICFYNCMILLLDRVERPDAVSVAVAFVALAVYGALHKYLGGAGRTASEDCARMTRTAQWQNKMNVVSGLVVAVGLSGSMLGFIFLDELAAVVVGSILVAMGATLIIESKQGLGATMKCYLTPLIIAGMLAAGTVAGICLLIWS